VLTSGMFKDKIEEYQANNKNGITFVYLDSALGLKVLSIPFFGAYLHFYLWLFKARKVIKKIKKEEWINYEFAHHVTYSTIKMGTPLFDIPVPVLLGPLGGAAPVDKSLRKYFGSHYFSEWVKEKFSSFLSIINPAVKKSVSGAKHIFYSNSYVEKFILRYKPVSLSKMYDAGLADYFAMEMPQRTLGNEINIIWVGRMLPRKGLNLAIESFNQVSLLEKKGRTLKLIIAGEGAMRKSAEALAAKYKLQDNILFLGNTSHNVLVDYYSKGHVFLFPSLKDSCPMQVFEAMATGLPVVTLDHQGMTEQIIAGTGKKIPIGAGIDYPVELAKAIQNIISGDEAYSNYCSAAYKHGQEQIWSKRIKKYIDQDLQKIIS